MENNWVLGNIFCFQSCVWLEMRQIKVFSLTNNLYLIYHFKSNFYRNPPSSTCFNLISLMKQTKNKKILHKTHCDRCDTISPPIETIWTNKFFFTFSWLLLQDISFSCPRKSEVIYAEKHWRKKLFAEAYSLASRGVPLMFFFNIIMNLHEFWHRFNWHCCLPCAHSYIILLILVFKNKPFENIWVGKFFDGRRRQMREK